MTLKELFRKVDFDHVWPEVLLIDPKMANSVIGMKQAFDQIRVITPEAEEKPEIIKVSKVEETNGDYISVSSCSNHYRRIVAGREIEVEERLNLTDEQLAAHCLWELTLWGFSDEDVAETFEDRSTNKPTNKYWKEYYEKERRWFPPIPEKEWERSLTRKNRSKRKRDYRHEKRLKQLRRLAKIEELQQYAERIGIHNFVGFILRDVESFSIETIRSYSEQPSGAVEYMCNIFSNYWISSLTPRDFAFVFVSGGNKAEKYMNILYHVIEKSLGCRAIIHKGDNMTDQITVKIIKVNEGIRSIIEMGAQITNSYRLKQYLKEHSS